VAAPDDGAVIRTRGMMGPHLERPRTQTMIPIVVRA
jgi:hypothetical protein